MNRTYNKSPNSTSVSPALRMIALSVYGFRRVWRGIVIFRTPLVIPICFVPRLLEIQKPAFLKTTTTRLEETSVKSIEYASKLSRICHIYFAHLSIFKVTLNHVKIGDNSITNIINCIFLRGTLTMTAGKSRYVNIVPILAFMNDSRILHHPIILWEIHLSIKRKF